MGEAQGTYYAVTYFDHKDRNFQPEIDSLLKRFDQSASLWVPSSVISKINQSDSGSRVDDIVKTLCEMSFQVAESTKGHFDITVGPLVNAWGFGFREGIEPDSSMVDSIMQFVGYNMVDLNGNFLSKKYPDISIDFNAIAQGYSVDLIGDFLETHGIEDYLVDVGGEVLGKGRKSNNEAWVVGVEKPSSEPYDERRLQIRIELNDKAVATSGSYRKFFVKDGIRYSHTINPLTGYPVEHSLLSVSVTGNACATADAYATAFMVMGVEKSMKFLEKNKELDAFFIYSDENGEYQSITTKGFEAMIIN